MAQKRDSSGRYIAGVTLTAKDSASNILKGFTGQLLTTTAAIIGPGALVFAMKSATVQAIDFEKGIAEIRALGVEKPVAAIRAEIDQLSRSFGQSSQNTIKAYYDAISAGVSEAGIVGFLEEANTLALAGNTSVATATDILTSLRSSFAETDNVLAATINATKNLGKTTVEELNAIGNIAPTAEAAGLSIQELGAALAVGTVAGIRTKESITALRTALAAVIAPSSQARAVAKDLKIEFSTAAIKTKGFSGFIADLSAKVGGNTEKMAKLFGSVEAFNIIQKLAAEGGGKFDEALAGINEQIESGAMEKGRDIMEDTASVSLAKLREEFASLARQIGDETIPAIKDLADTTSDLLAFIREDSEGTFSLTTQLFSRFGSGIAGIFKFAGGVVVKAIEGIIRILGLAFRAFEREFDGAGERIIKLVNILNIIPGIDIDIDIADMEASLGKAQVKTQEFIDILDGMAETAKDYASVNFDSASDSFSAMTETLITGSGKSAEAVQEVIDKLDDLDTDTDDDTDTDKRGGVSKGRLKEIDAMISAFQKATEERLSMERELIIKTEDIKLEGEALELKRLDRKRLAYENLGLDQILIDEFVAARKVEIEGETVTAIDELRGQLMENAASTFEGFISSAAEGANTLKDLQEGLIASIQATMVKFFAQKAAMQLKSFLFSKGLKKKERVEGVKSDIPQVFSGAYKAIVGIPIVGPILAPLAAAAAVGAVLKFAGAFEQGGEIPRIPGASPLRDSVIAAVKPGERVLDVETNEAIKEQIRGGGGGGGVNIFYQLTGVTREFVEDSVELQNDLARRHGLQVVATELA